MVDCNETKTECFRCLSVREGIAFYALCSALILSVLLNILCCVLKLCSGKGRGQQRTKQRLSSRQMEENPIYGNLNYQCDALYTEAAPLHPSASSSSLRNPQRVSPDSQPKSQDCYANLTLKAPRAQSGQSSPQKIHAEAAPSAAPAEVETGEKEEGTTDGVSAVSELYASVQTQKTKIIDSTDEAEEYANHL